MSAASRCLNNILILQKVLESSDLLANLQFRLVNKRFDREVVLRIRTSHKKINVCVVPQMLLNDSKIEVNGSFVHPSNCFKFLINTAGVRVQEFDVKTDRDLMQTCNWPSTSILFQLIDEIEEILLKDQPLKVFKNMHQICDLIGCENCIKNALKSREYGPVHINFLYRILKEPKHFDYLIVDDQMLCRSATTYDDEDSRDQESALNQLAEHISSYISCDHLQLSLYNHPDFFEDGQITPIGPEIPREFLEVMCTNWMPKSVGLSVMSMLPGRIREVYWIDRNPKFTQLRFFDPYESTRVSRGFMLDHMNVDLDDAPLKEIFREDSSFFDDNLIANVRKVFPARHYSVNLHRMSICHQLDQSRIEQLIRAVIRGSNQSNTSPVTIRISSDITDKPFDIPETLSVLERVLTCSVSRNSIEDVFGTTRRIAKSFRISHKFTGLEMNLEIYVDKKQLEEAIGKDVDLGFLKHYVD